VHQQRAGTNDARPLDWTSPDRATARGGSEPTGSSIGLRGKGGRRLRSWLGRPARKRLNSQLVGEIELTGNALELPGQGLTLIAYTAEALSRAREQLDLIASWSADPGCRVPRPSRSRFRGPDAGAHQFANTASGR
jgi:hypothetical protein